MDMYEELGSMMGTLEAYVDILETIILNSKNEKANIYLRESMATIDRAVASMSDALFENTVSPAEYDD